MIALAGEFVVGLLIGVGAGVALGGVAVALVVLGRRRG